METRDHVTRVEYRRHDTKTLSSKPAYDKTLPHLGVVDEVFEARSTYADLNARLDAMVVGASGTFLSLTDTPSAYTGQGGKVVAVKATVDGLEFIDAGSGSGSMTTVKESGVQLGGADIVTLDFGAGFDLTEDPDTEINISLDFSEAAPTLDQVNNPAANKSFNMTTRTLQFLWTNPGGNPMELEASGAYTGALLHIHQHTGNPGSTYLLEIEATDADVEHIKSIGVATTTEVLGTYVSGDTHDRFALFSDGKMEWGPGNGVADLSMYRSGVGVLTLDGQIVQNSPEFAALTITRDAGGVGGAAILIQNDDLAATWAIGVGAGETFSIYRSGVDAFGDTFELDWTTGNLTTRAITIEAASSQLKLLETDTNSYLLFSDTAYADAAVWDVAIYPAQADDLVRLRFFRGTTTSGGVEIQGFKGDGSTDVTWKIDSAAGAIQVGSDGGIAAGGFYAYGTTSGQYARLLSTGGTANYLYGFGSVPLNLVTVSDQPIRFSLNNALKWEFEETTFALIPNSTYDVGTYSNNVGKIRTDALYYGSSTVMAKKYGFAQSYTTSGGVEYEIGRFTLTGNSQNITIYGKVIGVSSGVNGVTEFNLQVRSNTLPSITVAFSQVRHYMGRNVVIVPYYKDNGNNTVTVVVTFTCNSALYNTGCDIWVNERSEYEYWEQATALSVFTNTGFTEITEYASSQWNFSGSVRVDLGNGYIGSLGDNTLTFTRNSANYIGASDASGYLVFRTQGSNTRLTISTTITAAVSALFDAGLSLGTSDDITMGSGSDIVLNTSTGTRLGTSTSQKLGFWGSTAVVQPTVTAASSIGESTPLSQLLNALDAIGLINDQIGRT